MKKLTGILLLFISFQMKGQIDISMKERFIKVDTILGVVRYYDYKSLKDLGGSTDVSTMLAIVPIKEDKMEKAIRYDSVFTRTIITGPDGDGYGGPVAAIAIFKKIESRKTFLIETKTKMKINLNKKYEFIPFIEMQNYP